MHRDCATGQTHARPRPASNQPEAAFDCPQCRVTKLPRPPAEAKRQKMAGPSSGAAAARTRWELENNIQAVSEVDGYFKFNLAEQQAIQQQKPWARDPHYFKQ